MDSTFDRLQRLETALTQLQGSVRDLQRQVFGVPPTLEAPPEAEPPAIEAPPSPTATPPKPGDVWTFPGITGPFTLPVEVPPQLAAFTPPLPAIPQPANPTPPQTLKPSGVYKVQAEPGDRLPPLPPPSSRRESVLPPAAPTIEQVIQKQPAPHKTYSALATLRRTEFWLNKVGIVLFLFGVAFLFKYAIDKQWITEEARLGAGVLLGSILLAFGLRLHTSKRHFSQVLMGGAIATYYITGYAAYNVFPDLHIPYEAAFAFMGLATLLAFVLSLWGDDVSLSLIGAAGGLLTPFVLNASTVYLPFLMAYTCLVLAGTGAIYIFRGWRSLLWTSVAGGWAIILVSLSHGAFGGLFRETDPEHLTNQIAVQAGIAAMLLAFWALPVLHEVLWHRDPLRFRRPPLDSLEDASIKNIHLYLLTACAPFISLAFSVAVWLPTTTHKEIWGWVSLGGALLFTLAGWLVKQANARLAYLHTLVAIGLFNIGLVLILEGNALILALTLEAACLHLISFRYNDVGTEVCGTLIFGGVGLWMVQRLVPGLNPQSPAIFNLQALTDLAVMALAFGASFLTRRTELRLAYRGFAHVALLAWLWREIHAFPNGDGYVMLAWAAYGLLLHVVVRKLDRDSLDARSTIIAAHLAFEGALGLLAYRMATDLSGSTPLFNQKAALDLIVMGMALVTSFLVTGKRAATVYRLVVHAAVLAWLWRESTSADFTNGYVMLRWTAYVATIAFISHRLRDRIMLAASAAPYPIVALLFTFHVALGRKGDIPFLNTNTLVDLVVLALTLAVSFIAQPRWVGISLRLGFHAGILAILWRELPNTHNYSYVMLAWAAYIALILFLSDWVRDRFTAHAAHIPLAIVAAIFSVHITLVTPGTNSPAFFNLPAMLDIAVIALAVVISFFIYPIETRDLYRLAVHAAVLALIWHELSALPYGYYYMMFGWAAYAVLLHIVAWLTGHRITSWVEHVLAGAVGTWLIGRIIYGLLTTNPDVTPIFNTQGLADLGIILLAVMIYWIVRSDRLIGLAYGLWLHLAVLGWLWQELGLIRDANGANGNGYVSVAWGLYALVLIGASFKLKRNRVLMTCGLTTLFAVAAKLFLIDLYLYHIDVIWRILLFLGFGGLFLLVSYFFQNVVRRVEE
jgi:hypothetical protein